MDQPTSARLAPYTTLQLGGDASQVIAVKSSGELIAQIQDAQVSNTPIVLLGGGSNVVISDRGFAGRCLLIRSVGVERVEAGDHSLVTAEAGEYWDELVSKIVEWGLAGVECLSGIPGRVGATPIQNVGAYGQEVSDTIERVWVYDRKSQCERELSREDCCFGYRDSVFRSQEPDRYVVLRVQFRLRKGPATEPVYGELREEMRRLGDPWAVAGADGLRALRNTVIALRRKKGMVCDEADVDSRSAGSFFTNPLVTEDKALLVEERARLRGLLKPGEKMPRFAADQGRVKLAAGWLIERAGCQKGHTHGRVAISSKHALALVNLGGGTTRELVELACHIRDRVVEVFDVLLRPEPIFVGFEQPPV